MQGIYNFLQVEPDLGTSGAVEAESFAGLRADGYQIVINLLPNDSKYATAGEAEIVADLGMDYVHIPVDFSAPIASNYDDFAAAMKAAKGKKIYVHCAANWRVSCFVAVGTFGITRVEYRGPAALDDGGRPLEYRLIDFSYPIRSIDSFIGG